MYGKIFASLFTGSMYGKGSPAFALMSYIIANMKPDRDMGFQVELNVKDLANRIGEPEDVIQGALNFLCAPDPDSRSQKEEGRRLKKIGTFDYQVVNGVEYNNLRNEEDRREKNRGHQQRHREKKRGNRNGQPLAGESEYVRAAANGTSEAGLDKVVERHLPVVAKTDTDLPIEERRPPILEPDTETKI